MRTLLFFVMVGLAGALGGALAGGDLAAKVLPDAGTHGPWYAARATGLVSYLCIWFSLVGGLMMSSAWFDGIVGRARLLAMHQTAAIAGLGLGLAHALVLIPDGWTQFGLRDLFLPFGSYYEPALTGLGTIALYLSALVTASFWFRSHIGIGTWRLIHYTSLVAFFGALWHGLQLGTDAETAWVLATYLVTSLSLVTGLVVRVTYVRPQRARVQRPATAG
jgi:predicted ferric reductase